MVVADFFFVVVFFAVAFLGAFALAAGPFFAVFFFVGASLGAAVALFFFFVAYKDENSELVE